MSPSEHDSDAPHIPPSDADGVRIGGSALLIDIAASAPIGASYPLLAAACAHDLAQAGGPATLADSLGRATSCTRLGDSVACALTGGAACAAHDPDSHLHAIIDGGPCWRVTRSATAVALVALGAELQVTTSGRSRWLSTDDFLAQGEPTAIVESPSRESVVAALLPAAAAGGFQRLAVSAQSAAATAALCLAAVQRTDGDVRLVLGGVSPRPYRVYNSVEEETTAGGLDEDAIAGLADRALLDAETDARSASRVDAAAALLRDAITAIASA